MRGPDAKGMAPWVLLLVSPLLDIVHGRSHPVWAAVAGLVAMGALYLYTIWLAFIDSSRAARRPLPLLAALTIILALAFQGGWFLLFVLTAIAVGVAMPGREGPLAGIALCLAAAAAAWVSGSDLGDTLSLVWGTFSSTLVPWIIIRLFDVITLLAKTREELAEAAVERERLRFARDLHDLLGHTLSVMVVKAEAVRRVLPGNVAAAVQQAADIEQIGRRALTEVRTAVSGYRGHGLSAEMDSARTALADAEIDATIRARALPLPPETDALLGWAVREGVTNVLRHSAARSCQITLDTAGDRLVLEIRDDGRGTAAGPDPGSGANPPGPSGPAPGHGLRGLAERVAAAGGHLGTGTPPGGGFQLSVDVPLEAG
jgi:two-component system sensor histidine kinase DesK